MTADQVKGKGFRGALNYNLEKVNKGVAEWLDTSFAQHDERTIMDEVKMIRVLGKDFLFMDEQYRIQVGNSDFFIDLVFYHRSLQCLIAFELKADKFKPEHLGQLNFYLEALDRDVRKQHENPSIGILLCKNKDSEVVEYALSRNLSPAMVAKYQTIIARKESPTTKVS